MANAGTAPATIPQRRRAALLWVTASSSTLGDGIRTAALPLLAVSVTRDPIAISAVLVCVWLPWLLFSLHAGAIVDRLDRARLLRDVQLSRFAIAAMLALAVFTGHVSMALIYSAAFLIGLGEVLVDTSVQALVPAVVPDTGLETMNARLTAVESLSNQFIGPSAGGLLFAAANTIPFGVDAASFLASAGLAHRLRGSLPPHTPRRKVWRGLTRDVVEGLRYLAGHRMLRTMALWVASTNLAVNSAEAVLVLYAVGVLHVGSAGYGLLLGAAGVGGMAGAAASPFVVARLGRGPTMLMGNLMAGAATLLLALVTSGYLAATLQFLIGFAAVSFTIVGRSVRQALTPAALVGRVTSSYRLLGYGAVPIGAAVGGWLAREFSTRAPFVFAGCTVLGMCALMAPRLMRDPVEDRAGTDLVQG